MSPYTNIHQTCGQAPSYTFSYISHYGSGLQIRPSDLSRNQLQFISHLKSKEIGLTLIGFAAALDIETIFGEKKNIVLIQFSNKNKTSYKDGTDLTPKWEVSQ